MSLINPLVFFASPLPRQNMQQSTSASCCVYGCNRSQIFGRGDGPYGWDPAIWISPCLQERPLLSCSVIIVGCFSIIFHVSTHRNCNTSHKFSLPFFLKQILVQTVRHNLALLEMEASGFPVLWALSLYNHRAQPSRQWTERCRWECEFLYQSQCITSFINQTEKKNLFIYVEELRWLISTILKRGFARMLTFMSRSENAKSACRCSLNGGNVADGLN